MSLQKFEIRMSFKHVTVPKQNSASVKKAVKISKSPQEILSLKSLDQVWYSLE